MQPDPPSQLPVTGRKLLRASIAALLGAAAIFVMAVLPVEFHRDPTGFGRLSGLNRLAAPAMVPVAAPAPKNAAAGGAGPAALYYPTPYRSDSIDIPLQSADESAEASELEYKVRMKAGDSLVYSWNVTGLSDPELFYYDFHSEAPAGPGAPAAKVVEYRQATGLKSNGTLIAPLQGVHGWFLQNQSPKPVMVHLRLSGFYQLVPPGEYGNLAGIKARPAKD